MPDETEELVHIELREKLEQAFEKAYPDITVDDARHMARNLTQVITGTIDIGERVGASGDVSHMDVANAFVYWSMCNTYLEDIHKGKRNADLTDVKYCWPGSHRRPQRRSRHWSPQPQRRPPQTRSVCAARPRSPGRIPRDVQGFHQGVRCARSVSLGAQQGKARLLSPWSCAESPTPRLRILTQVSHAYLIVCYHWITEVTGPGRFAPRSNRCFNESRPEGCPGPC